MDSAYTAQGRKFCFAFFEMKEDLYEKNGKEKEPESFSLIGFPECFRYLKKRAEKPKNRR